MTHELSSHINDSEMMRLLDGEPVNALLTHHLAACHRCDDRRESLRQASSGFSSWMTETAPLLPAPPSDLWLRIRARARAPTARPRLRPTMAAAAIVSLIVVGTLAAEPTRVWLGARLVVLSRLISPVPVRHEPSVSPAHVSVAFVPEGPELVVTFDRAPAAGRLVVSFEGGPEARVDVETEADAPPVVVRADGFRIRNDDRSTGTIRLRVPTSIESVRLVLGDRDSRVVRPPSDAVVDFPVGPGGG